MADLIVGGEKLIENRTWPTNYRGWMIIHAAKIKEGDPEKWGLTEARLEGIRFGALVGAAFLVDVLPIDEALAKYKTKKHAKYAGGPICWVFNRHIRFPKPAIHTGQLGLWSMKEDVVATCQSLIESMG